VENFVLLKRLMEKAQENHVSFHIPGHKNGKIYHQYEQLRKNQYFSPDMIALDVTEMPGTDNLHAPRDVIQEAQERAAKCFGADATFFLIDGTSSGNISALMAVANPGEKVVIPRDCHKSLMHGLVLGGLVPVYISPELNRKTNMSMGISPEAVERTLVEHPDVKAVVVTYPNYYGIASDIKQIADIVHRYDKVLIVDEAHGSHFLLNENLPIPALEAGADIVSQSIHKTLPSFTQSSMLHVKSKRIDMERLRLMLMMNQSSSPSYLLMASLDIARGIIEQDGRERMAALLETIQAFEERISGIEGLKKIGKEVVGQYSVKAVDPTRLVFDMTARGLSGVALDDLLREKYGIQMEMSDTHRVVGVSGIANDAEDFEKLANALLDIAKNSKPVHKEEEAIQFPGSIPEMKLDPRSAVFAPKKMVPFSESVGKISGEYIIPYPPGIAILCPGEEITQEMLSYIHILKEKGVNIIGPKDEQLEMISVIA